MKIIWSPAAQRDRDAVWDFIASHDIAAAARIDELFADAIVHLADFPLIGHAGEIAGTRELTPHKNYRLVYKVVDDVVLVLAVIHAARQWPRARK